MKKPALRKVNYLDYHECSEYLEKKYGYEERNYKKHRFDISENDPSNPPYCDFWHWVVDTFSVHNGCDICFSNDWLEGNLEDWQKEILEHYLSEFGSGPNREVEFRVEW